MQCLINMPEPVVEIEIHNNNNNNNNNNNGLISVHPWYVSSPDIKVK